MANNTIQIRRTTTSGRTPNTTAGSIATNSQYIAVGELALNLPDKKLFSSDGTNPAFEIGSNLATTSVGGGAFAASSTQVTISGVPLSANGGVGTGGQVLTSNGATGSPYWSTIAPTSSAAGLNTQVQFNDGGSALGATAGFTFTKTTNNVTIGNTVTVGTAVVNSTNILVGTISSTTNGASITPAFIAVGNTLVNTVINVANINLGSISATTNGASITPTLFTVGNTSVNTQVNVANVNVGAITATTNGASVTPSYIAVGNTLVNTVINVANITIGAITATTNGASISPTQVTVGNTSINTQINVTNVVTINVFATLVSANLTGTYANLSGQVNTGTFFATTSANVGANVQLTTTAMTLGADAGTATNSIKVANSLGNTVITATSITGSGWNFIANASGVYHSGATGVVNAFTHSSGATFTANSSLVNAAAINVTGQVNTATFNASTSANVGPNVQLTTSTLTLGSAAGTATNSITVANTLSTVIINSTGINMGANGDISGRNASFSGNLSVTGTLVTINVSTIQTNDPLIRLAANNTATTDPVDIGIYGNYTNTTASYFTAFFRDSTSAAPSKVWRLVDGLTTEPGTTTVTQTNANVATLVAYVNAGGLVTNSSVVNITATSSISSAIVANTLSLTTALAATSGGTGTGTYATGDLLYASSTSALSKLTIASAAAVTNIHPGGNGQILQITNNLPAYGTLDGGTF